MSGEANQVKWRGVRPVAGIQGVWPAIDATRVNETNAIAGVGTVIVYTVPADKKLFLASMFFCTRNVGAGAASVHAIVRDENDVEVYRLCSNYFAIAGQQTSGMQYIPACEAEEGWDVVIVSDDADLVARFIFAGWLEDA